MSICDSGMGSKVKTGKIVVEVMDSTVQEANMTYPTDAKILRKLGTLAAKVSEALKKCFPGKDNFPTVDLKEIALKARNCFFQKRYATQEEEKKQ